MEIKFRGAPAIFSRGCFMTGAAGGGGRRGISLRAEFSKTGRPEIIRKILLVDDDGPILRATTRILRELDLSVVAVDPSGPKTIKEQVLNFVAAGGIDLIVMDGHLPGASGAAITKELRSTGYQGYIFANSSDPKAQDKILTAGADFTIPNKNIFQFTKFFV